jgi:hypothetical protein
VRAFASYNKLRTRVALDDGIQIPVGKKRSLWSALRSHILKT